MILRIGDILGDVLGDEGSNPAFCEGAFGRDSYFTKRVEAIGSDWVVARRIDGPQLAEFAGDIDPDSLCKFVKVRR